MCKHHTSGFRWSFVCTLFERWRLKYKFSFVLRRREGVLSEPNVVLFAGLMQTFPIPCPTTVQPLAKVQSLMNLFFMVCRCVYQYFCLVRKKVERKVAKKVEAYTHCSHVACSSYFQSLSKMLIWWWSRASGLRLFPLAWLACTWRSKSAMVDFFFFLLFVDVF